MSNEAFAEKAKLEILTCPVPIKSVYILAISDAVTGGVLIFDHNDPRREPHATRCALVVQMCKDLGIELHNLFLSLQSGWTS